MPIRIQSYGGLGIWFLRKYCSNFTSKVMLEYVSRHYEKLIVPYIHFFLRSEKTPAFRSIMFETMNRCNGQCAFCPANVHDERRPFKKMNEAFFQRIIGELKDMKWQGAVYLNINNEPLLDKRLLDFSHIIRENLPESNIHLITNGTLLTPGLIDQMADSFDYLVVNDYSEQYRLSTRVKKIYQHVQHHPAEFQKLDIVIVRRYTNEILPTRAGSAPNKPEKNNNIITPCIYPFTDLPIFPDGKVGMCCNDCYERSEFGDLNYQTINEVWDGEQFRKLRLALSKGRDHYPACMQCDVCDAGSREQSIKAMGDSR